MLRMDRYPYCRLWAIWDDQDLVAVVVDKQGAVELLRRLQALALPPAAAGALCPQHPWLPRAPARAGARPSTHAAGRQGNTRPSAQRRTATCLRCRA